MTNPEILKRGISEGIGNALLVKLNQIGTVTETLDAVRMAGDAAYASVMRCPAVPAEQLVPFQRVRELESVVWELGMAVMDASYSEGAQDRLQRLLRTVP